MKKLGALLIVLSRCDADVLCGDHRDGTRNGAQRF